MSKDDALEQDTQRYFDQLAQNIAKDAAKMVAGGMPRDLALAKAEEIALADLEEVQTDIPSSIQIPALNKNIDPKQVFRISQELMEAAQDIAKQIG